MAGPFGLSGTAITKVEGWLISEYQKWPSYLRAGAWAALGGGLVFWLK